MVPPSQLPALSWLQTSLEVKGNYKCKAKSSQSSSHVCSGRSPASTLLLLVAPVPRDEDSQHLPLAAPSADGKMQFIQAKVKHLDFLVYK